MREAYRLNKTEIYNFLKESDQQLHLGLVYLSSDIVSFEVISKAIILSLQRLSDKISVKRTLEDNDEENNKKV